MRPPIEPMLTIRPRPARSGSSSARVTASRPKTLTSYWPRIRSSGTPSSGPATAMPALLTSPASGPPPTRNAVARPMPVDAPVITTVPRGMAPTLSAAAEAVVEPRVVQEQLRKVERGRHVQEHAGGEELGQLLAVDAAEVADEVVELRVATASQVAHLRVAARGVRLQLHEQQRAVGEDGAVGLLHRLERAVGTGVLGRRAERLLDAVEAALDGSKEQALLGAEQAEGVGLRDPDVVGDRADRGAVQPGLGEVLDRGGDER